LFSWLWVFEVSNLFIDDVKVQLPAGVNQELNCLNFIGIFALMEGERMRVYEISSSTSKTKKADLVGRLPLKFY